MERLTGTAPSQTPCPVERRIPHPTPDPRFFSVNSHNEYSNIITEIIQYYRNATLCRAPVTLQNWREHRPELIS